MNMDEINLVSRKQKSKFKLKAQVGPFIVNTRVTYKEVESLLREMNFKLSFSWPYDPLGAISLIRSEHKSTPYIHISKPEIEQYATQEVWEENTL